MRLITGLIAVGVGAALAMQASAADYLTPYVEPADTATKVNAEAWADTPFMLTWASKDVHYARRAVPQVTLLTDTLINAWQGERIGAEALIVAPQALGTVGVKVTSSLPAEARVQASMMRYVITTAYNTCGYPDPELPAYTVPDRIDVPGATADVEAQSVRPVWVSIEVPRDMIPGRYPLKVTLYDEKSGRDIASLDLTVDVSGYQLPLPAEQAFELDLWQQPYAIARYYRTEPWSADHIEALRPFAEMLARAGQRTITAIMFYEPWGEQSNDKFLPMVDTRRRADGTWSYDYTVIDRYVELMDSAGVKGDIACFTMVPWEMTFRYYDEARGVYDNIVTTTDTPEYKALWIPFLRSLAAHANDKGWNDRLVIMMDERALPDMLNAYNVAQEAVPGIRMALAGNYHPELIDSLYSYTLLTGDFFPPGKVEQRRAKGQKSLMYTCCANVVPNLFSNSAPADAAFIAPYALATGYDGYLHWSFSNWTDEPMTDTRFHMFAPGDTYFVYPEGSSVRYERLLEGIALGEKVRILRKAMTDAGDMYGLQLLEDALMPVRRGPGKNSSTAAVVNNLHHVVDRIASRRLP